VNDIIGFDLSFPRQYLKAALVASFFSVCVLVGIFFYLNRYTKRRYFSFWTGAWLFHAFWLALCIALQDTRENLQLMMLKQWCMGASAVFLLSGSAWFLNQRIRPAQLGLFLAFLFSWSCLSVYQFDSPLQMQVPIFGLVGVASWATAWCFCRFRKEQPFLGAGLVAWGFGLWGGYVVAYPFFQQSDQLISCGYLISAVLQLFIAVSMIILVLEEVRHTNQLAFQKIRSFKSKTNFLQKKVLSTEERYRSLFDQASEGIVITDAEDLRVLELNQTARRLLGVGNGDAAVCLWSFCQIHPAPAPAPQTGPEWFAAICRHRQMNLVRRDGAMTPVEADGAPISFDSRPAYQFFLRELTERARLEQQLRQAEKLSALGQMISGVAHELNNPLAVIKGYLELILRRDELRPSTRADLEKVALESNRAAKLVSNFLSFAREQPVHRETVDVNEIIRRAVELRRTDPQNSAMDVQLDLDSQLPSTQADPDQLQQVLVNLLSNSLQALAEVRQPGRVQITSRRKNDLIQILVEDNGPGVPPEVLPYIFEPFFTTKEVGRGTGLGLSIAHSVMTDHHGKMAYQPSALGGAGFVLDLPILSPGAEAAPASAPVTLPPFAAAPKAAPAQILILDDEESIAELLGEMLGLLGYSTTLSHSGPDALQLLEQRDFDLIISDFRMPKMNGQEFYQRAIQRKPALARRIIFLTGDVVSEDTQGFLQSTGNPHLSKPFQLARVEQTVAQVLESQAAGS
jgi:signal transduction histidine kinase/ActR/RegA family two-component response regulator